MRDHSTSSMLLLLDERDNVLVVRRRIRATQHYKIDGREFVASADLPLGHKVARKSILDGEKVIKYGAPIGTATTMIAAGSHVHVHNLVSDYTPTFHLPIETGE